MRNLHKSNTDSGFKRGIQSYGNSYIDRQIGTYKIFTIFCIYRLESEINLTHFSHPEIYVSADPMFI